MNLKWPFWIALAAALIGSVSLFVLFSQAWPAAGWKVLPTAQLVEKARQVSSHFGLDTGRSKTSEVPSLAKPLERYAQQHRTDLLARAISPLSVRITFKSDREGHPAEVGLDSGGMPIFWRAPKNFKPQHPAATDDEAAQQAFLFLAGGQAASFKEPVHSAGEEAHEQNYVWRMPRPAHSEIRESIKVVSKDSVVQTAERKIALASNEDDDSDQDTGETESYWNFVAGIYGLLCTITVVIALGIYILWLFKKAVGHKFPLRFGGAALLLLLVTAGGSPPHDNSGNAVFAAIFIACFAAVGRAISTFARPKWMSLEQLCLLAPFAKPTGDSLAAGVLFSPLLVAVPVLVGSFVPHSAILPRNVETFYSRSPLLTSLDTQAFVSLLGVFGFALPALARVFRWRWLHLLIVLPLGTIFFTDEPRVITGPIAAPLIAGLATLLIFWFLYASFDLLAVLALQLSSGLVLTTCVLMQKGFSTGLLLPALAALLLAAYWLRVRGQPIPQGDPGATTPTITGFRAEREKLQAEFSLARRAQQDMLPDTPPSVPGYTIAASCTPSLEVGGDLYDFLKLPDGRIGIGVADVSGKGVPAALYMTLTKGLLSAVTKNNSELAQIVEEVNRHLHGVTRKKVFVTMVLGFLDAEKQVLECVRAGHNPVVWRQPGSDATTLVAPGGLGLGITAGRVFGSQLKIAEMALSEGDAVVFYSDGITEAMNSDLEQFGEQRLMDAVQKTDNMDAAASRDSILTTVKDFLAGVHPQDDMTLVVLRVGTK